MHTAAGSRIHITCTVCSLFLLGVIRLLILIIRLTATVTGKWSWTAKYSRSDVLDSPQRHPVSHPVKPRTRSRSCICRGRSGSSNPPRTPAAAARIAPSLAPSGGGRSHPLVPSGGGRSHLPLPPLRPPPTPPPRLRRVRHLPILSSPSCLPPPRLGGCRTHSSSSPPRAGEPGQRWIYIHGQFKVRFSCT
jgi:hypothetical protein